MKIALIIAIAVIVILIGVIYGLLWKASKFTDEYHRTSRALRKAREKIRDLQTTVYNLRQQLANAKDEETRKED